MGNRNSSREKHTQHDDYEMPHRSSFQEGQQGEHESVGASAVGILSSCSDLPSSQPEVQTTASESPPPRHVDKQLKQQDVHSSEERQARTESQAYPNVEDSDVELSSSKVSARGTSTPMKEYTLPQEKIEAGYRCAAESHLGLVHVPHAYTVTVCIEALKSQLHPRIQPNEILITPVVNIRPHSSLTLDQPAIIELIKSVELTTQIVTKQLVPLHSLASPFEWKELESHECELLNDRVRLKTNHFGYVCIIARFNPISKTFEVNPVPEKSEHFTLEMKEYPNFKMEIPRRSIGDDTNFTLSISFCDSDLEGNACQSKRTQSEDQHAQPHSTASSVVELMCPRGNVDETGTVSVTLPIPDYHEIKQEHPDIKLQLWTSKSTGDGDSSEYSQVADESTIAIHHDSSGNTLATANVTFFSRLKFAWSRAITKIINFFISSVRCRCLVFMSDEERKESCLTFNIAVFLYRYGDAYQGVPNHPHLVFDSKAPIEVSAGSVEYLIMPDDDLFPDILDNSHTREPFRASSLCPGNERKDMPVRLFTMDTHLPKRHFATLVIKHGWKKPLSHDFILIKPSDSRSKNATLSDARPSHLFDVGAERLRNVMKELNNITVRWAAEIADHMAQVAQIACSNQASPSRNRKIVEELNSIVGECSKIKHVSEEVSVLCSQETSKKIIDITANKLPEFERKHEDLLSVHEKIQCHKDYSEIDSDDTVEKLTTNVQDLITNVQDLMVVTDKALVTLPYAKVQELNRKFKGATLPCSALSRKPRLHELDRIERNGTTVKVIDKTASRWKRVGIRLHFEGHDINIITANNRLNEDACRNMFTEWLDGKGRQPKTWETVLSALNEADFGEVASDLSDALSD